MPTVIDSQILKAPQNAPFETTLVAPDGYYFASITIDGVDEPFTNDTEHTVSIPSLDANVEIVVCMNEYVTTDPNPGPQPPSPIFPSQGYGLVNLYGGYDGPLVKLRCNGVEADFYANENNTLRWITSDPAPAMGETESVDIWQANQGGAPIELLVWYDQGPGNNHLEPVLPTALATLDLVNKAFKAVAWPYRTGIYSPLLTNFEGAVFSAVTEVDIASMDQNSTAQRVWGIRLNINSATRDIPLAFETPLNNDRLSAVIWGNSQQPSGSEPLLVTPNDRPAMQRYCVSRKINGHYESWIEDTLNQGGQIIDSTMINLVTNTPYFFALGFVDGAKDAENSLTRTIAFYDRGLIEEEYFEILEWLDTYPV